MNSNKKSKPYTTCKACLTTEELRVYKKVLMEGEQSAQTEFLDFIQQYVNKAGIPPSLFTQKAHLGDKSYREIVKKRTRNLSVDFNKRICIGIAIFWLSDIVRIHIDRKFPQIDKELRKKKIEELKKLFVLKLGIHMKMAFQLMEKGINLENIAIYLNQEAGDASNFNNQKTIGKPSNKKSTTR